MFFWVANFQLNNQTWKTWFCIIIPSLVRQDSQLCHLIWACHIFQGLPQFWSWNLATALVIPRSRNYLWNSLISRVGGFLCGWRLLMIMIMISLPKPQGRANQNGAWNIQGATGWLHSLSFTCFPAQPAWWEKDMGFTKQKHVKSSVGIWSFQKNGWGKSHEKKLSSSSPPGPDVVASMTPTAPSTQATHLC